MYTDTEITERVMFLKLLADQSRLRILALLTEREHTVGALAAVLKLKEPTVSHHLSALRKTGVLSLRTEGRTHFYKLEQKDILKLLHELKPVSQPVVTDSSEQDQQTLSRFFLSDGRLKSIPTQQSKQKVLLRKLVNEFDFGISYTEREVSEKLKAFHPDFAYLRRLLVDWKYLSRTNSIYTRNPNVAEEAIHANL